MWHNLDIETAVTALQQGEVIAYPTEAVYGLGCDPWNAEAVTKILQIKHRSIDKGFILIATNWEQVEPLVEPISPPALYTVLDTWPGPITWVFPAKPDVPYWIRGQHNTVAVRITDHPTGQALCQQFGKPLVSTSANVQGHPPIRDYRTAVMTFKKDVAVIIEGKVGSSTRPTEIRDAISGEVLRPG